MTGDIRYSTQHPKLGADTKFFSHFELLMLVSGGWMKYIIQPSANTSKHDNHKFSKKHIKQHRTDAFQLLGPG